MKKINFVLAAIFVMLLSSVFCAFQALAQDVTVKGEPILFKQVSVEHIENAPVGSYCILSQQEFFDFLKNAVQNSEHNKDWTISKNNNKFFASSWRSRNFLEPQYSYQVVYSADGHSYSNVLGTFTVTSDQYVLVNLGTEGLSNDINAPGMWVIESEIYLQAKSQIPKAP